MFQLDFSKTGLTVHFVYRDGKFESEKTVDFGSLAIEGKAVTVYALTKDFAVAMQAIADLGVVTSVAIDVNSHALLMQFSTTAADYRLYIPTCTVDGIRSNKHFKHYEPTPLVIDAFENYDDQAEGDFYTTNCHA